MHTHHWWLAACAFALAACGGGDDLAPIDAATAQGYAADATTMPVAAATGAEAAVGALEAALGTTMPADARLPGLAGQVGGTAGCRRGGSLAWTETGGPLLGNARLDAGETWSVRFDGCATGDHGPTLDGTLSLAVAARASGELDLSASTSALAFAQGDLQAVLDGRWREQRSTVTTPVGGTQVTGQISSPQLTLATSSAGASHARYTLRGLAWTVVRTYDAEGLLAGRTHQGTLAMSASSPRRAEATLAISTDGCLTIGPDGRVGAGVLTLRSGGDSLATQHDGSSVTLSLDRGSDGRIDRRWTLQRRALLDLAG